MRVAIVVAVACLSAAGLCAGQDVMASIKKSTNIPAQQLVTALKTLAHERGFHVVFLAEVVGTARTQGAVGDLTTAEALTRLLEGTNLVYSYLDEKTVTILPANSNNKLDGRGPSAGILRRCPGLSSDKLNYAISLNQTGSENASDCVESYSEGNQVLARAIAGEEGKPVQNGDGESNLNKESTSGAKLDEIVVTAQKRSERLQDVPVPVTALDPGPLAENGQSRIQDYFATVPGLNISGAPSGGGTQSLAIRGITTGANTNPSVGITIDDVPYGSSTSIADGSLLFPDIDPSDLERIEVLRGPQGTLYGASSIGGLIKFATKDPSVEGLGGRIQVLGNGVEDGQLGYGVHGMVNVPLSDTVAIRASGFMRRDPGYVDNILTGKSDVNRTDVYGGRLATLWRPSGAVSLKLSALLQNNRGFGNPAIDANGTEPVYGDLKQARMPGTERYNSKVSIYSATMTAKLGSVDLTSVTGYGVNEYFRVADSTSSGFSSLAQSGIPPSFSGYGVTGVSGLTSFETRKFSQELRLSSASGQTLEWLVGTFYTHESSPADTNAMANDLATGAPVGELVDFNFPTSLSEFALFGDLTAHFTDRFDFQFGGRQSKDRQVYNETDSGPLVPAFFGNPSPFANATQRSEGSDFTYLVTPRFRLSPDLMIYARLASGYRVGGNNVNAVVYQVPPNFGPDKTYNYDLGVKGSLFNGALTFDASAYYIDWKHIQISLTLPGAIINANGGRAKSQGLEFSMQARPITGLTITAAASVNDAQLTQDLPPESTAYGLAGDRLPYSSRFSGSVSANQDVALTGRWLGFIGGDLMYVGEREGEFTASSTQARLRFPAYARVDLRTGVRDESWTVNLFVNNVTNKRGIVGGGLYAGQPGASDSVIYIQPRTVGLSLAKVF